MNLPTTKLSTVSSHFFLLSLKYLPRLILSHTLILRSSTNNHDQVSHPRKTTEL